MSEVRFKKHFNTRVSLNPILSSLPFANKHLIYHVADTRLNHMPFMQNPLPLALLVSIYLSIVIMGKRWMEHRLPMRIDPIIIAYNLMQIIVNSAMVLAVSSTLEFNPNQIICVNNKLYNIWLPFLLNIVQIICYIFIFNTNFSFRCEPCNYATDFNGMFTAYLTYSYFILKLIDYFDTVFFILRKKWNQVSFLHVYHHLLVSVAAYIWVLFVPGLKMWHY